MKKLSFIALSLILIGACAPTTPQPSPEIGAMSESWQAAFNAGDIETLAAMYSEDARLLPPNAELSQGREAVRAAFGEMIDSGVGIELETVEAISAGELAYRLGTYHITVADEVVETGKYVETWEKVGGEWKITNDIWNSDSPAAGGPVMAFTHDVEDPAVWLAAWEGADGRRQEFREHGVSGVRVFQNPEEPNRVGLLVEFSDQDAFMSWLESEQGQQAAAEDTVVMESLEIMAEVR
jgi:ketosteroid isomerase-like protein